MPDRKSQCSKVTKGTIKCSSIIFLFPSRSIRNNVVAQEEKGNHSLKSELKGSRGSARGNTSKE
jgi:hypothetical protein